MPTLSVFSVKDKKQFPKRHIRVANRLNAWLLWGDENVGDQENVEGEMTAGKARTKIQFSKIRDI